MSANIGVSIQIDGLPCLDVVRELENVARLGYPRPDELARCNCILNPLGEAPARGWLLVSRQTLNQLNLNGLHRVTLIDDRQYKLTLYNLVITREPGNVTPGQPNDPSAAFVIELGDKRHLLADDALGIPCNRQYNVRAPGYGGAPQTAPLYYADSMYEGSAPWTWQQMVQDLWALMPPLGSPPPLPFIPNGTPEGWKFPGVSAWKALNQVLFRIGCAVRCDLSQAVGQYSIVEIGVGSEATATNAAVSRKIYDREYQPVVRGKIPAKVRVYFHVQHLNYGTEQTTPQVAPVTSGDVYTGVQWATNALTSIDITGPDADADPYTVHEVWDDLPALANADGSIANTSALQTRAQDHAAIFYRLIRPPGGLRFRKIFSGIWDFQPDGTLKGVAWRQDVGGIGGHGVGGIVTEAVNHPYWILRASDNGSFVEEPPGPSTSVQAPAFGPGYPNYPVHIQHIRLTDNVADANGLFTGFAQQYDPAVRGWLDKEPVVFHDANGASFLPLGRYTARLHGFDAEGFPDYAAGNPEPELANLEGVGAAEMWNLPTAGVENTTNITMTAQIDNYQYDSTDCPNWWWVLLLIFKNTTPTPQKLTGLWSYWWYQWTKNYGDIPGRKVQIMNDPTSTQPITLSHENSASQSYSQLSNTSGQDTSLMPGCTATYKYVNGSTNKFQQINKDQSHTDSKGCLYVPCLNVQKCVDIQQSTPSSVDKNCLFRNTNNQLQTYDNNGNPTPLNNTSTGNGTPQSGGNTPLPGNQFYNNNPGTTGGLYNSIPTQGGSSGFPYVWQQAGGNTINTNGSKTITLNLSAWLDNNPGLGLTVPSPQNFKLLDWPGQPPYSGFVTAKCTAKTGTGISSALTVTGPNGIADGTGNLTVGQTWQKDAHFFTSAGALGKTALNFDLSGYGAAIGDTVTIQVQWNITGQAPAQNQGQAMNNFNNNF